MKNDHHQITAAPILKTPAILLLCLSLSAQTIVACTGLSTVSCGSFSATYSCEEDDSALASSYSTQSASKNGCATTGSVTACSATGTTVQCSYTVHNIFCDGTSSSYPVTFSAPSAKITNATPCP
jgi:hypothetical protein